MMSTVTTRAAIRDFLKRLGASLSFHRTMLTNASFLTIAAGARAFLGFIFWWCTARTLSPESQGLAAAAISVMNFLAFVGEFGFGTLLMGRPHGMRNPARLISGAIVCSVLFSLILCWIFLFASTFLSPKLQILVDAHRTLFLLGVGATAAAITIDGAAIGLLTSSVRMIREIVFSVLRLIFLYIVLHGTSDPQASAVLTIWISALAASLIFTVVFAVSRHALVAAPDLSSLREFSSDVLGHHLLNLGALGPSIALPFLVTEVLSPTINAVFYSTWMLLQAALLVPFAIATALFATVSAHPESIAPRVRFSLKISTVFGLISGAACYFFLQDLLRLFNPAYPAIAGSSLNWLGFTLIAIMIKCHYIAVMRLEKRMYAAALVLGIGALFEIMAAILGGHFFGLFGLALFWSIAIFVQAVVQLPTILSCCDWGGRWSRPSILENQYTWNHENVSRTN
jgi:O-antigen/teichoic acid export membrane protein